jgi:hypothetical protein
MRGERCGEVEDYPNTWVPHISGGKSGRRKLVEISSSFGWHMNSARLASFYLFPLT